jgi:hypothetical protein
MKKQVLLNGIIVGEFEATGDQEADLRAVSEYLEQRGLRKEVNRYQATFNAAQSFANTSAYLYKRDLQRSPRVGASVVPFVVNAAFGIELYFKALAQKHGVTLSGHRLTKLNKALPAPARSEVESVIPRCAAERNLPGPPDFDSYVHQLDNTFVEWRYFFEKERTGRVDIEPTIFVMQVLHEACLAHAAA